MRSLTNELSRFSRRLNPFSPVLIYSDIINQNSEILSQGGFKENMKKYVWGILGYMNHSNEGFTKDG